MRDRESQPKVTVVCITFNQARFIGQAIESFLAQKTDFAFEVIIHDDASTDGTQEIIKDYRNKYPNIINLKIEKDNQFSIRSVDFVRKMYSNARGKYIAVCEGDDFWTDEHKLQKQVNFLDKNPDHSICFHPVKVFYEDNTMQESFFPEKGQEISQEALLRSNFIQTNSVMYRKQTYKPLKEFISPLDWYYHLYHARFGKIGFIDEVMAAYRRHEGGVWWDSGHDINKIWRMYGKGHLALYMAMAKMYPDKKYELIINRHIAVLYDSIIGADLHADHTNIIRATIHENPESLVRVFRNYKRVNNELSEKVVEVAQKDAELVRVQTELAETRKMLNSAQTTIHSLYNSRTWKIGRLFVGPVNRLKKYTKRQNNRGGEAE